MCDAGALGNLNVAAYRKRLVKPIKSVEPK